MKLACKGGNPQVVLWLLDEGITSGEALLGQDGREAPLLVAVKCRRWVWGPVAHARALCWPFYAFCICVCEWNQLFVESGWWLFSHHISANNGAAMGSCCLVYCL